MEQLQDLTRLVTRLWYTERQVIAVDLLSQTHMMSEEELVFKMKLNVNEVRKALGKLRLDRFVKVETQVEQRPFDGRAVHRMFYYLDYKSIYDTLKYKIWKIQKYFRDRSHTERNDRDYVCSTCHQRFTQLEVTAYIHGPSQLFKCPYHRPEEMHPLQLEAEKESESHLKMTQFMASIKPLVERLKQAETVSLPSFHHQAALKDAQDAAAQLQASRTAGDAVATAGAQAPVRAKIKVAGASASLAEEASIVVDIQDQTALRTAEERAREELEKERKRKQNALPFWHKTSAIASTGVENENTQKQSLAGSPSESGEQTDLKRESRMEMNESQESDQADIMGYYENYYKSLIEKEKKEHKQLSAEGEEDDDDDDDEEEEEEFVEVVLPPPEVRAESDDEGIDASIESVKTAEGKRLADEEASVEPVRGQKRKAEDDVVEEESDVEEEFIDVL